jgi:hypothetical protein
MVNNKQISAIKLSKILVKSRVDHRQVPRLARKFRVYYNLKKKYIYM